MRKRATLVACSAMSWLSISGGQRQNTAFLSPEEATGGPTVSEMCFASTIQSALQFLARRRRKTFSLMQNPTVLERMRSFLGSQSTGKKS